MKINEVDDTDEKLDSIFKECSNIVSIFKETNKLLLRGSNYYTSFELYESPKDRETLSFTMKKMQPVIDEFLKEKGFIARRSNSIFCTSSKADASSYGKTFIIFPTNGFDFTYFRQSDDLIIDMAPFYVPGLLPVNKEKIFDKLERLQPTSTNLERALQNRNEVLIHGYFYTLNYHKYINIIENKLGIDTAWH